MLAAEVEREDVRLRGSSPHRVRTSRGRRSVQPVRNRVEVVTEQFGVDVERHRCGRVPELGVSEQTYFRWRNRFGGLKAEDAKRLKELEKENARLKRLLADVELEKDALREVAEGNF
jgi:hypothetical protein